MQAEELTHHSQHLEHDQNEPGSPAPGTDVPHAALAASLAAAALLAACGGGGGSSGPASAGGVTGPGLGAAVVGSFPTPASDADAARFLLQAQFSASDAEIAAVRSRGYAPWLVDQFNAPAATSGVQWLSDRGYAAIDANTGFFDNEYPGDNMIWAQLMASPDAVRQRLALALSEFFVVSLSGLNFEWRSQGIAAYWDTLVRGVGGNFRKLLEDITLNPAMGSFLNTKGNQKEDGKGRQPDENYAREVMQLFTIGLYQLNLDGTEKRDGSGNQIETYSQSDVSNIARVFTGYDFDETRNVQTTVQYSGYTRDIGNTSPATLPMALNARRHSTLAATFLGVTIAANTSGAAALKTALDTLFNHPNVGPFFGRQMIQRLVTSNPSPAYVQRVAAVFNNNGAGVRGDMRSVLAAVLLDDEARGPAGLAQAGFGRLREPMVRFVQWARSCGLASAQGSWKIGDLSSPADGLAQSPLRPPSVFNFFRPGYVPPSTGLASARQVAPEFQLVNESTVGSYLNFMQTKIREGFYVPSPELPNNDYARYINDIKPSYAAELALVTDAAALVRRLNLVFCAGQLSAATQTLMVTALNATPVTATSSANSKLDRVRGAVLMTMAAAEYLIQK